MFVKLAEAVALMAPLAFVMGVPFPLGLTTVQAARPGLVPWAWGVNGFASVTATSLAVMIAMSFGLSRVVWTAAALYAAVALLQRALPGSGPLRPAAGG